MTSGTSGSSHLRLPSEGAERELESVSCYVGSVAQDEIVSRGHRNVAGLCLSLKASSYSITGAMREFGELQVTTHSIEQSPSRGWKRDGNADGHLCPSSHFHPLCRFLSRGLSLTDRQGPWKGTDIGSPTAAYLCLLFLIPRGPGPSH